MDPKYRIFQLCYHHKRTKKVFCDFSLSFSFPHGKDKEFTNAPERSHEVKTAPDQDKVVMRSFTCDLSLDCTVYCRGMICGLWQWYSSLSYVNLSENLL